MVFCIAFLAFPCQAQDGLAADAGGPYTGSVGQDIAFNGLRSGDADKVTLYSWDFGDGGSASGSEAVHRYLKAGFYNVTLEVSDSLGRKGRDVTGAYVSLMELSLNAKVYPVQDKYDYGDSLMGIDVIVSYPDNSPAKKANVSGSLMGARETELAFKETGDGIYHADLSYPIMRDEGSFLELSVKAVDVLGNSGTILKRLPVSHEDLGLEFYVSEPHEDVFSPGQNVSFEAGFTNLKGRGIKQEKVYLYDPLSNNTYEFSNDGESHTLAYRIPAGMAKKIALQVHGTVLLYDTNRTFDEIVEKSLEISNNLNVLLVEPEKNTRPAEVTKIAVNITYPDGEEIGADKVKAVIGGKAYVLTRKDGLYATTYLMDEKDASIMMTVEDPEGNTGGVQMTLAAEKTQPSYGIDSGTLGIIFLLGLLSALAIAFLARLRIKNKRMQGLKKEYLELRERREAMKKVTKSVMQEYYTRKITAEDAKKRMLDYEKEAVLAREKMKGILHRLGIKKSETEGREDAIEAIVEKLENREDPASIKQGLSGTGVDPRIVDEIRRRLF